MESHPPPALDWTCPLHIAGQIDTHLPQGLNLRNRPLGAAQRY